MSLDAHIFRSEFVEVLALELEYHNPNTLEGSLAMHCYNADARYGVGGGAGRGGGTGKNKKHGGMAQGWLGVCGHHCDDVADCLGMLQHCTAPPVLPHQHCSSTAPARRDHMADS